MSSTRGNGRTFSRVGTRRIAWAFGRKTIAGSDTPKSDGNIRWRLKTRGRQYETAPFGRYGGIGPTIYRREVTVAALITCTEATFWTSPFMRSPMTLRADITRSSLQRLFTVQGGVSRRLGRVSGPNPVVKFRSQLSPQRRGSAPERSQSRRPHTLVSTSASKGRS